MDRIHLSPPDVTAAEREALLAAFDSGWIAPVGPEIEAFEDDVVAFLGGGCHAAAVSSGTAGLHLALRLVGVGPGDVVIVPSLTFIATANAVAYQGAEPVFVDSETRTWNVDTDLVVEAVETETRAGRRVAAVVTVDLYGQCAEHARIREACEARGIPVIEDAAEALGASWHGRPAGRWGRVGVFSFNGNKIVTTGGGGMLVADDPQLVARARHLATQAREPVPRYEHHEIGYNYRLPNLAAALGRAQLRRLPAMIERRRRIRELYGELLGDLEDLTFNPLDPRGDPNHWLTVVQLPRRRPVDRDTLVTRLAAAGIEVRPSWTPLHRQPVWRHARAYGGAVADEIFDRGLCLPSGSSLTDAQVERVASAVRAQLGHG
ncbi:MAG: aminotransferase class I/II-fold pyridoxal phosphate-dependent enzyme [Actinomyces sp.]|nr:MAG: aminotransferase class I/II-fold pyridoxal phosphate-dependent enzyme [Actinomyces sp.]